MIRLQRLYAHDFKQLRQVELRFPPAGRILIQGKNEAGKSTLFEAIFFALFGQALAAENIGKPNLDDLIGYEKNKARVELDLTVRNRLFRITRTLNRGKPNVWQLDIMSGDPSAADPGGVPFGRVEEVRGNRPVNDRLVSELGFDAEALLNTCFVEQKKLEKLEGLTKAKREESLSKLLNLERLLSLEETLKLRGDDEKLMARLAKRVELAQAQQELPGAQDELETAERQLRLIELQTQITHAAAEKRAAEALGAQLQALAAQRAELGQAVARVNALDKARQSLATALDRFDLLAQQNERLEALRRERAETGRAVDEHLPALERRARDLRRLGRDLARLAQVEAARDVAQSEARRLEEIQRELDAATARGRELEAAIAAHESRAAELDTKLREYDLGEALGEWAAAARELAVGASGENTVQEKEAERRTISAQLRRETVVSAVLLIALVTVTVIIPLALLYFSRSAELAVGAGAGLLAADAAAAYVLARRGLGLWNGLARAAEALGQAQGEATARRQTAASSQERLRAAEAQLREQGAGVPASIEAAQSRRIEIAATLEGKTRAELSAERDAVRERLNYARAQRDELGKRLSELTTSAASGDAARCRRVVATADRILNHRRPVLAKRADELGIPADLQTVRDAFRAAEAEIKSWRSRVQQANKLEAEIADGQARALKSLKELEVPYVAARALLNGQIPEWGETLARTAYAELEEQVAQQFEAQGGDQVRSNMNALENKFGAGERELRLREQAGQEALAQGRAILTELEVEDGLSEQPTLAELDALATRFEQAELDDRPQLARRVTRLNQRLGALRDTRDRLERDLGLQGELIDLEAARADAEREQRSQEERKQGAELVLRARKRIVQKILPATMDYMRRILPPLTRDRYHDAELDAETYKIKVWDERAGQSGAWKEKNIFSGGTKDQFSLALRLAFALATLPQERGASPGFIFLDEPLGSFDDERAAALLYLLTEGEIARAFDQIFLISHIRVPEDRFTHRIRLENGLVAESNLG